MAEKQGILVVSFGTSHEATREKTIGAIEESIKTAYPAWQVERAFTSGMIMKVLKSRDNLHIDNVSEALAKLKEDGFKRVHIQPTHIINGDEYEKMVYQAKAANIDNLTIGKALLTTSEDYDHVCEGLLKNIKTTRDDVAIVLMGHGTGHFTDAAYSALDYRFKALGHDNVFIGTVEGYPTVELILSNIKKKNYKKVILLPFMVVAGDHATNDMAGEEGSWKALFEKEGYEVECILKGIGEFPEIRKIYLDHIDEILGE
ncbi:MAG: sirohydrochlorin cobaltochelatase [Anaerovoracaceae bacterium]